MKVNSILTGLLILGAVAVSIRSQTAPQKPALAAKVAIVAMRDAMLSTQDGRKAAAAMQATFATRKTAVEKLQAELVTIDDRLRKGGATLSPEARQTLSEELASKKKIFDRDAQDLSDDAETADNQLMQDISGKMGAIIDEYARANSYTVVMDAAQPVLWAAETANITPDIVKLYDQKHPVAGAAPAAAPAAPKPAAKK
jgi:outer membrane protein